MRKFALYEGFNSIDENILYQSEQDAAKGKIISWKRWGTLAACICLAIAGAAALPGLLNPGISDLEGSTSSESPSVNAVTESEPPTSSVPQSHPETSDNRIPKSSSQADSAKKSDAFIDKALTLPEALANEPFGAYMLSQAPAGFQAESIHLYQDENSYFLSGLWTKGTGSFDEISWRVSFYSETDADRVTSIEDTKNYDLGLYSFPLADSVPIELFQIVDHPIFQGNELTLDAVKRRAYTVRDTGDTTGKRMNFGVLYGDILVEVSSKGISPEWLYEKLSGLDSIES